MKCSNGHHVLSFMKFCSICGEKKTDREHRKICPRCKEDYMDDPMNKYCGNDGVELLPAA